jgi:glycosyltransferase involved in cell wall biosynthesis
MPVAVLDLDLHNLPPQIADLERYRSALVLLRLHGRPAGQALIPIHSGVLEGEKLRDELLCAADSAFWEQWLNDYLEYDRQDTVEYAPLTTTVAVCTRDRPKDLQRCLEALMRLPDDEQKFLVIDNCPSTDETQRLVENYKRVRYIREDHPGLNIARNRALREATGEVVAFTDDDAAPDPNWLRALLRNFADPRVLCVTGLTMPLELETDAQEWFQRLGGFSRGFKRIIFDRTKCNPFQGWAAGAGVNMALRRSFIKQIGFFNEALDVGTPTRGGGDTEIFIRILSAGYRIVYDPQALNWHRHRYKWEELQRQLCGYEVASFAIWTRYLFSGKLEPIRFAWQWLWRECRVLIRALLHSPNSTPSDLVLSRFWGAMLGPTSYLYSYWRLQRGSRQKYETD